MASWNEATQSWEFGPGEIEAQVDAALATESGEGDGTAGLHIRYVQAEAGYRVDLSNGLTIGFPARLVEGLAGKGVASLRDVHFLPDGDTIEWGRLNIHLSLSGLLAGSFGNAAWNARIAQRVRQASAARAGRATSPRKAASSAANGMKGGRPRKNASSTKASRST